MKAAMKGKLHRHMKAVMKAKNKKVVFLGAMAVVGEWARDRVCDRYLFLRDAEFRYLFLKLD